MDDLISRQTAIDALNDEIVRRRIDEDTNDDGTLDEFDTEAILRRLPSAHKTGKWIYKNDLQQFFCSECGYPSLTYDDTYIYGMDLPNYCEDCGADMRGEQDDKKRSG